MFDAMLERVVATGGDLAMVVHGSERAKIHRQFPAKGKAVALWRWSDGIYDLRKSVAIVLVDTAINVDDELVAETRTQIIIRDAGGFGGDDAAEGAKGRGGSRKTVQMHRISASRRRRAPNRRSSIVCPAT